MLISTIFLFVYIRGEYKKVSLLQESVLLSTVPDKQVSPTGDIALAVGETATFDGLRFTFDRVEKDNRCPVDVMCIQAGAATARVVMRSAGKVEAMSFVSDKGLYRFANYAISITSVSPGLHTREEIDQKKYRIVFHVINVLGA